MSNLSDFGERKFIDYALRRQPRPAATYYLGLSTTPFSESDDASAAYAREPSGNGYARTAIKFTSASNRSIKNNNSTVTFPQATGPWGTVAYWGIFDGPSSSANLVALGNLTGAVPVGDGTVFFIATGDIEVTVSSVWSVQWANWLLNGFFTAIGTAPFGYIASAQDSTGTGNWLLNNSGIPQNNDYIQGSSDYFLAVSSTPFDLTKSTRVLANGQQRTSTGDSVDLMHLRSITHDDDNFIKEPWWGGYIGTLWFRDRIQSNPGNDGKDLYWYVNNSTYNKGYNRQQISFGPASTSGGVTTIKNLTSIQFPEATSSWGSIGYWAIYQSNDFLYDNQAFGVSEISTTEFLTAFLDLYPIMGGSFTTPATVNAGDILRINAGDFVITPQ